MVFDYNVLSSWETPALVSRDKTLVNKTRVMGMSEKEAMIHIVALVCTLGLSLPINLGFGVWHAHRYGEVKKERTWIRQILDSRNMSYRGRGQWVEVRPPNTRPQVQGVTPNRGQTLQAQTMQPNPNRGQREQVQSNPNRLQKGRVQPNPNRMQTGQVQPNPNRGQRMQVQPNPNRGQRVQPNPNRRRRAQATRPPPANNDPQMQYAPANAYASANNDPQMQFVGAGAYASANDSQQVFGNNADDYNLQMQYVETNAYVPVENFDQEYYGNNADNDLQMQVGQDIGNFTGNDLEQDVGNGDALTEAIVAGGIELFAS